MMFRILSAFAALAMLVSLTIIGSPPKAYAAGTGVIDGVVTVPAGFSPTDVVVQLMRDDRSIVRGADVSVGGTYSLVDVPEGVYVLDFIPTGVAYPLVPEYSGGSYYWGSAKRITITGGATAHENAVIDRGAVLKVNVADARGPIAWNASVELQRVTADPLERGVQVDESESTSTTRPLTPATYHVTVSGQEWLTKSFDLVVGSGSDSGSTIVMAPGSARTIDVVLQRKGVVTGSAAALTPSGEVPWQGTVDVVDPVAGTVKASAAVDAGGAFEITGIEDGTYKVYFPRGASQITRPTYWPEANDLAGGQMVTVATGQVRDLGHTTLVQGGSIGGNVNIDIGFGSTQGVHAAIQLWKLDDAGDFFNIAWEGETET